jgi:hypothetical protein
MFGIRATGIPRKSWPYGRDGDSVCSDTCTRGTRLPEKFEAGVKNTLTLQKIVGITTTTEQAGLTIIGVEEKPKPLIIENEEPIEIKAK